MAAVQGEQKGEVRVVRVQQIERAEAQNVVAGNRREKRVQQVIIFFIRWASWTLKTL